MSERAAAAVQMIEVDEHHAGQRIDNFLLTRLKGVPKSRIYRLLRTGEVRVNRGRIKANYRLQAGDAIRLPPIRQGESQPPSAPGDRVLKMVEAAILYEDKGFIIFDKPSGLAVHGGSGLSYGLIEAIRALRPEAPFLELAHRLDRDTSGCIVVCKRRSALRTFHELLQADKVEKRYLALVKGRWARAQRVDAPLKKNILQSGERMVRVDPTGKPSQTLFRPLTHYQGATLLEAILITGRTHQVRVHAAHSGHPIAGDDKYGDEPFDQMLAGLGLKRLFLHAASLRFTPPEGTTIAVEAPLEPALQTLLSRLTPED